MNIKQTMVEIHQNNVAKGFWDQPRNTGEMLMLVVSELSEALEADRKGNHTVAEELADLDKVENPTEYFGQFIKDSFEDELADAVIRIFDIAEGMKIDLPTHIRAKMDYNATRERLHGKKY